MPRQRKTQSKRRSQELTPDQEMELIIGDGNRSCFESEEDRRAAWFQHREQILADSPRAIGLEWYG